MTLPVLPQQAEHTTSVPEQIKYHGPTKFLTHLSSSIETE